MGRRGRAGRTATLALAPVAMLGLAACDIGERGATFDVPGQASDYAVADLDGDGDLDVTTAPLETGWGSEWTYTVTTLVNDGSGRFTATTRELRGVTTGTLALGDVDGDGDVDRVMSTIASSTFAILVELNDGTGGFTRGAEIPIDETTYVELALGDIDGDGNVDIVAGGQAVTIHHGTGDGTFGPPEVHPLGDQGVRGLEVADLDDDGHLEVVATTVGPSESGRNGLTILPGDGAGGLGAPQLVLVDDRRGLGEGLAVGDADGDGDPDLLRAGGTVLALLRNDGAGGFAAPEVIEVALMPASVALGGDLDEDGHVDLVVSGSDPASLSGITAATHVLFGDGDGGFGDAHGLYPPDSSQPVVADLDGDGVPDLVTATEASPAVSNTQPFGALTVYRNRLDGERPEPPEATGGMGG